MSLFLKLCSCGKPVSPSKGIVKGDQQTCTASEIKKIKRLQIQESEISRYIDRGAEIIYAYQFGRWILSQW